MNKYIDEIAPVTFGAPAEVVVPLAHDGYVAKFSAPCLGAGWASALAGAAAPGTKEVARLLDDLGVHLDATVDAANAAIKASRGTGRRRQVVSAALRWRRTVLLPPSP